MNGFPAKLGIIFVFYNEEANVRFVAESMLHTLEEHPEINAEIILVDNGSTDTTRDEMQAFAANPRIELARVETNVGFGGGVLEGLRHVLDCSHAAICDGDGQIDPRDVIRLYAETDWTRYEMAKARRVERPEGPYRLAMSRLFHVLFALTLGTRSKDHTGKPKILTRDLVRRLNLASEDFFIDMEIVAKVEALAVPYREVATRYLPRHGGKSKVNLGAGLAMVLRSLQYRTRLKRFVKETGA